MSDDSFYHEYDERVNLEDAEKLEDTETPTTEEDGEQPEVPPSWNDDSGDMEIL